MVTYRVEAPFTNLQNPLNMWSREVKWQNWKRSMGGYMTIWKIYVSTFIRFTGNRLAWVLTLKSMFSTLTLKSSLTSSWIQRRKVLVTFSAALHMQNSHGTNARCYFLVLLKSQILQSSILGFLDINNQKNTLINHLLLIFHYYIYKISESESANFNGLKIKFF